MNKKERNSSFELLRVLAMIPIILYHYSFHGFNGVDWNNVSAFNTAWINCMNLDGKFGVNIFVLISAYFMVNQKFSIKKIFKLYGTVWFYSVGITMLLAIFKPTGMPATKLIVYSFMPIIFTRYWFITDYFIVMLFSPLLNILIHKMDKATYKKSLILMIVLTCIAGAVPESLKDVHSELFAFFVLYFIAGYIRLYGYQKNKKANYHFIKAFVAYAALIAITIWVSLYGKEVGSNIFKDYQEYFWGMGNPLILASSVEVFAGTTKVKSFSSKIINFIAGTTFGVYLIHDNKLIRTFLWSVLFKNKEAIYEPNLVLHTLMTLVILYVVCILIDILRQISIEKVWFKICDKIFK